jgi:methionine-rich copper-binding protein CopC
MRPRAPAWQAAILVLGLACSPGTVGAHAFPERSEPRVGAVVRTAPTRVQIWFDGDRGARVDRGDSQVDPQNRRVLRVNLPSIPPGTYKVSWGVLAVDGHRTEGDYTFTLKPAE